MTKSMLALVAAMFAITAVETAPVFAKTDGLWSHDTNTIVDRRKPRVKGGSGCDDPEDVIEHPECR